LSATGAATVAIRDAAPDDAVAACRVLRESISRLCVADHRNDPAILNAWLANKQPEIVAGTLTSTETAHRFYQSAGYVDDGVPTGKFGTSSGYPMSKQMVASR